MKLSIGIVGLPNVGKSTLFKLLTKQEVNIANYPFCTIDPNVGIVPVPDDRLNQLARLSKSEQTIPAVVEFYDIAGLVKGASQGEGLGNQFLAHIREVNAVVIVTRCFSDETIVHTEGTIDPVRDLEVINAELILKDLETVDKRLASVEKETKGGAREAIKEKQLLAEIKFKLAAGQLLTEYRDDSIVKGLGLLSAKKQIYLLNGREIDVNEKLISKIKTIGADYLTINLQEAEAGVLGELVRSAYRTLSLISFFTTGPKETKAWTVESGTKAPQAGGAIHSDFERGFIRAEVIDWRRLMEAGSWATAKSKGQMRLEGKNYVVQDGDVMLFHHN